MRPIDPKLTRRFIHPSEENLDPGLQTAFLLRGLTFRERTFVESQGTRMIGATQRKEDMQFDLRSGDMKRWRIKLGLAGVENFPGWATEPGPFDGAPVAADSFLDTVPDFALAWVNERIKDLTEVSEADAGKS